MANALWTDLYEVNMAASYLRHGLSGLATFSLYVRRLPPTRGFLVAAGIEDCIDWLEEFSFEADALRYLERLGFDADTLDALARLRFTGEVWAVPEGRVVLAREPILEVTAPIAEAQLAETLLLNQVTYQTALASKAARFRLAAAGRIQLVDFALRRAHGREAGLAAARVSAMAGFSGTSNMEAARRFGLRPSGTMAHSFVEAHASELDAFRVFAGDFPEHPVFIVDTYDPEVGIANAIGVIEEFGLAHHSGVRLDSGDLAALARRARKMLDHAGMPAVTIFVSGGLDEIAVGDLVADGVPVDGAGVGTRMGVSDDAPYLESVYKLVDYDGRPVAKLSAEKETLPAAKQVFRGEALDDVIGLRHEPVPPGSSPLLEQVMAGGRRTGPRGSLNEARARFDSDLEGLPLPARDLRHPEPPEPVISPALAALATDVHATALALERHGNAGAGQTW